MPKGRLGIEQDTAYTGFREQEDRPRGRNSRQGNAKTNLGGQERVNHAAPRAARRPELQPAPPPRTRRGCPGYFRKAHTITSSPTPWGTNPHSPRHHPTQKTQRSLPRGTAPTAATSGRRGRNRARPHLQSPNTRRARRPARLSADHQAPSPLALQGPHSPGSAHSATLEALATPSPNAAPAGPPRFRASYPAHQANLPRSSDRVCRLPSPLGALTAPPGPYRSVRVTGAPGPPRGSLRSTEEERDSRGGAARPPEDRKPPSSSGTSARIPSAGELLTASGAAAGPKRH